jgi:hypothetical protein
MISIIHKRLNNSNFGKEVNNVCLNLEKVHQILHKVSENFEKTMNFYINCF